MRQARVIYKGQMAGLLTQQDDGSFIFRYTREWISDPAKPAISLTLPKTENPYQSEFLFPFFFHMLPEGTNRLLVTRDLRIDRDDDFGLLLHTARTDTIGAVTIEKVEPIA